PSGQDVLSKPRSRLHAQRASVAGYSGYSECPGITCTTVRSGRTAPVRETRYANGYNSLKSVTSLPGKRKASKAAGKRRRKQLCLFINSDRPGSIIAADRLWLLHDVDQPDIENQCGKRRNGSAGP